MDSTAGLGGLGGRAQRRGLTAGAPLRHLDPVLLVTALLLAGFGALMVYSASSTRLRGDGLPERFLLDRQLMFALMGGIAMIVVASFSYRRLKAWGPVFYAGIMLALLFVLSPIGSRTAGSQRWISFGFFQFQPSELMKLAVVVVVALILSERRGGAGIPEVARTFAVAGVPAALIFLQPDLGTLLVLIAISFGMLLVAGARLRLLLVLVLIGGATFWAAAHVGVLHDYQVARLTAFLDPAADAQRSGYNLTQAMIAVGSGQIAGKGLFTGSQTNLDFVPEVHTDFIFTAVGEELGFVGSMGLLVLFGIFLWRGIRIAMLSKDTFGTLLAAGIVSMFTFQIFVNIGMTIGLSPITGIPLPFVSYGGTSLLMTFLATGLLLNIHMRRGI